MAVAPDNVEVLVCGVGTMGSMVLWELARRGVPAIGIEQFEPGHDRGSGHGESRIIRTAYYEGPEYVPLVRAAFDLWRQLQVEAGLELLTMTGALMIGEPDGELVSGVLKSALQHELRYELLDALQAERRYPQHRLGASEVMVVEPDAGFLRAERAIQAAVMRAEAMGATVVRHARIQAIHVSGQGISVLTDAQRYRCNRAVISVGSWLGKLLPELGLPLQVERQVQAWFPVRDPEDFVPARFPVFMHERKGVHIYGVPTLDGATIKVAIHHGGCEADPDQLDREVHRADIDPLAELIRERLNGVGTLPVRTKVCMYTNTPDRHFIVGRHPASPRVVLLGGFSGHGFKFAPVIGQAAVDLALEGSTRHSLGLFDPRRFAGKLGTS
jgi:sarcosine oxidase